MPGPDPGVVVLSIPPLARELQKHDEQIDEIEIERQRADQRLLGEGLSLIA